MASSDASTAAAAAKDDNEYLRKVAVGKSTLRTKLESRVLDRSFCLEATSFKPLNVTCYGSSSSKTPERYLEEARLLGYILSKRGHVCINGAGSFGCMAAMNDGVHAGDGHVRGVIHEMFLADNGYFDVDAKTQKRQMRRGSSHMVFENAVILNREEQKQQQQQQQEREIAKPRMIVNENEPIREILVAGTQICALASGNETKETYNAYGRQCCLFVFPPMIHILTQCLFHFLELMVLHNTFSTAIHPLNLFNITIPQTTKPIVYRWPGSPGTEKVLGCQHGRPHRPTRRPRYVGRAVGNGLRTPPQPKPAADRLRQRRWVLRALSADAPPCLCRQAHSPSSGRDCSICFRGRRRRSVCGGPENRGSRELRCLRENTRG